MGVCLTKLQKEQSYTVIRDAKESENPHTSITPSTLHRTQQSHDKCDPKSDDPSQTCDLLKRLIHGLQHYMSLHVKNKHDYKDEFNDFICNVYHKFLDDYIHLINVHPFKLENINKSLLLSKKK
eukprot:231837_1